MQLHSPAARPSTVSGAGSPQDVSLGDNVIDLAAFRRHKRHDDLARTEDQHRLRPQLVACLAVACLTLAAIVGPFVIWLLSRAAVLAS